MTRQTINPVRRHDHSVATLFDDTPDGFVYRPDFLTIAEEAALLANLRELPFKEFEFHGYLGHRRVVSYGFRYDFEKARLKEATEIPGFLTPLREKAAHLSGRSSDEFVQVLVTEYRAGTVIGWHKDKAVFGDVVGISLLSECRMRFRKKAESKYQRTNADLAPRSAYILRGEVREEWEHSIPPVPELRYSITFRTLR